MRKRERRYAATNHLWCTCGHMHRTIEAARACKTKPDFGGPVRIMAYERQETGWLSVRPRG